MTAARLTGAVAVAAEADPRVLPTRRAAPGVGATTWHVQTAGRRRVQNTYQNHGARMVYWGSWRTQPGKVWRALAQVATLVEPSPHVRRVGDPIKPLMGPPAGRAG